MSKNRKKESGNQIQKLNLITAIIALVTAVITLISNLIALLK